MQNIRIIRVLQRISQWELARITGVAQSKISLFENGYMHPKFEELQKIATALGVESNQLITTRSINKIDPGNPKTGKEEKKCGP